MQRVVVVQCINPNQLILLLFYISQGYQGLVDGGDNIKEVQWEEMSGIIELVWISPRQIYIPTGSLNCWPSLTTKGQNA